MLKNIPCAGCGNPSRARFGGIPYCATCYKRQRARKMAEDAAVNPADTDREGDDLYELYRVDRHTMAADIRKAVSKGRRVTWRSIYLLDRFSCALAWIDEGHALYDPLMEICYSGKSYEMDDIRQYLLDAAELLDNVTIAGR